MDDSHTLIKIAVFGVTMSIFTTALFTVLLTTGLSGNYDLDKIAGYRDDLVDFSGQSMLNQSPWVLTGVYTPWASYMGTDGHIDSDGWLYGESIDYPDIGRAAQISLSPDYKSSVPITFATEKIQYVVNDGYKWWVDGNGLWSWASSTIIGVAGKIGIDVNQYADRSAAVWNYTGYRYVFDPTLPFAVDDPDGIGDVSSRDGSLSIVWYSYAGNEGLSGALQIYGGDVLLASYAAADIIAAYQTTSGYATTYDFDFNGAKLTLSILFDQSAISAGVPLMQAWTNGDWTMAISSVSAGNFYDIKNSTAFDLTAGSMISTWVNIFTLDMPTVSSPWANLIMWILVVLPMSLALACIALKLVSSVRLLGGGL